MYYTKKLFFSAQPDYENSYLDGGRQRKWQYLDTLKIRLTPHPHILHSPHFHPNPHPKNPQKEAGGGQHGGTTQRKRRQVNRIRGEIISDGQWGTGWYCIGERSTPNYVRAVSIMFFGLWQIHWFLWLIALLWLLKPIASSWNQYHL